MGSWNAKILTLPLRRWNDDVAARCGFLISSLLRRIQLLTSFWRVVFNNTTPLCTNNNKMNLIPTWKLSRQIATIYLQTTHCQILVLFFLHGIPQKTTLLDFKSNSFINCFNSCGVQNVGGLWHRNLNAFSFTTAVDSSCKLDYQEQGWPSCAIGINYPETLFISTGKAPSRLENFQYGHSSKSVNYKCNRIIENLSKSKTIPSDITQSKDTLWLALCRILRW